MRPECTGRLRSSQTVGLGNHAIIPAFRSSRDYDVRQHLPNSPRASHIRHAASESAALSQFSTAITYRDMTMSLQSPANQDYINQADESKPPAKCSTDVPTGKIMEIKKQSIPDLFAEAGHLSVAGIQVQQASILRQIGHAGRSGPQNYMRAVETIWIVRDTLGIRLRDTSRARVESHNRRGRAQGSY